MRNTITILLSLALLFTAVNVWAVAYASDTLYIYEGSERIKDDIIVFDYDNNIETASVCGGICYWGQQYSREVTFYKYSSDVHVLSYLDWLDVEGINRHDTSYDRNVYHDRYSQSILDNAAYSTTILLPEVTNYGVTQPSGQGTAFGGLIGKPRCIKVDIKNNKARKVNCLIYKLNPTKYIVSSSILIIVVIVSFVFFRRKKNSKVNKSA